MVPFSSSFSAPLHEFLFELTCLWLTVTSSAFYLKKPSSCPHRLEVLCHFCNISLNHGFVLVFPPPFFLSSPSSDASSRHFSHN